MEAFAITPLAEDDTTFVKDAQQFLAVIADMQREAEQRRCLLDDLRQKEAAAETELEKCLAVREAVVARMAHTKAEGLELQSEYKALTTKQRAVEAEVLELRRQKSHWKKVLQEFQGSSSSSHLLGSGNTDVATVKSASSLDRALHAWSQLPHGSMFLKELKKTLTEFIAELAVNAGSNTNDNSNTTHNGTATEYTTAFLDPSSVFPHLPPLSKVEEAIILLIPFSA
ncbi:hypothetical protein ECC02_008016 [Trypanosoma cruzi]|uniref:Uncharacterized protein n=1 Tax=Trypanosoma cruzi TaxID=5693 RepID=A0A7J6XXT4_TRYCR|nr:hypothetical protein ECC02_008016 [Trypanosoma cruzi]